VGFKNRLTTVLHWFVSFVGRGRSERVVTVQQVLARTAIGIAEQSAWAGAVAPGDEPKPEPETAG
jgi:NADH dehydrogenase